MSDKQLAVLLESKVKHLKSIRSDMFAALADKVGVKKKSLMNQEYTDVEELGNLDDFIDQLEKQVEELQK